MSLLFEVVRCLGKRIRVSQKHWELIVRRKHLEMAGREKDVGLALHDADSVRTSQADQSAFLYYRRTGRYYVCVVCRHLNGDGFIITSYITDRIKEGREIWQK